VTSAPPAGPRVSAAARLTTSVNRVSRRLGLGSGTVIGGRAGLKVAPDLVARLAAGRPVALVSGTNGKTTTTRLLVAALAEAGPVVTNATGSNMPAGHAAALAAGDRDCPVVLEVDEGYLPATLATTHPQAVILLNLSRDQLDRTNEVRMLAGRWREALAAAPDVAVVANADDPLVVWAAGRAARVTWVSAGLRWRSDAVGCPACEGRIEWRDEGWACACGFARPRPDVVLDDDGDDPTGCFADGERCTVRLALPGRFNRANALSAVVAAEAMGVPRQTALEAVAEVADVAGRFTTVEVGGVTTRLLLAKNPAGWAELFTLVAGETTPVVVAINARVADGKDPSWLFDVAFEELAGRVVVATGDRARDLSVRLHYAEVDHETVLEPVAAIARAAALTRPPGGNGAAPDERHVDFIGNYTAFADLVRQT